MTPRIRLGTITAALLLASGCSDRDPAPAPPEAARSPTTVGSAGTPEPAWVPPTFASDLKASKILRPGHGLRVLRKLPTDNSDVALLGVLSDGRLLLRRGSLLQVEAPRGGGPKSIQAPDEDAVRGVFDIDDDGRHVVWVTTSTSDYFHFPWRMFSADLRTGVAREIAHHHDVGVDPVPVVPNGTRPRILGDRVYYAAAKEVTKRGRVVPAVYSVPIDGSAPPRIEVENAYSASTLGDRLVYTTSAFAFVDWEVHTRLPGRPGSDRVIAAGRHRSHRLSGTASDGRTFMWQNSTPHRACSLHFISLDHQPEALGPDRCGPVWSHYHHVGGEWAAFSTGSGPYRTYVYRFHDGTLFRLTDEPTFGYSYGSGDLITWRPDRGPDEGKTIVARLTFD